MIPIHPSLFAVMPTQNLQRMACWLILCFGPVQGPVLGMRCSQVWWRVN